MRRLIFLLCFLWAIPAHAGDWPTGAARGATCIPFSDVAATGEIRAALMPWSATVPANYTAANVAPSSQCNCRVAPTGGDYVISIKKYLRATPGTAIAEGTCTVPNGQLIGTFASNALYQLSKGDTLAIVAPTADATAAGCKVTIGYGQ